VRRRFVYLLACLGAALCGCGSSPNRPPDLSRPAAPRGTQSLAFSSAGVSFTVPSNWAALNGAPPLVATVASGRALVALWRYPRSEPLPADPVALDNARVALLLAARRRDPSIQVIRSRALSVDGVPAIELDALEHVAGQLRRVRSLHLFAYGAELVLDAYAPPDAFHAVDHSVFSPLKRSLRLSAAGA